MSEGRKTRNKEIAQNKMSHNDGKLAQSKKQEQGGTRAKRGVTEEKKE